MDGRWAFEVVVAYGPEDSYGVRAPAAARAVVRDDEGDLVYGARAGWEVLEGSFPLVPFSFHDADANHDEAVAPKDLDDLFGDGSADKSKPDCHGPGFPDAGCGCRSGPRGGAAAALLGLLALGTARRRRSGAAK